MALISFFILRFFLSVAVVKLQQIFLWGVYIAQVVKKTLLLHLYSCIGEAQKMRGDAEHKRQANNKQMADERQTSDTQPTKNSGGEAQRVRTYAEHLPASEPAKNRPISIIGNWTQHQCRRWDFPAMRNSRMATL
mgnify:CR=1 FL=1